VIFLKNDKKPKIIFCELRPFLLNKLEIGTQYIRLYYIIVTWFARDMRTLTLYNYVYTAVFKRHFPRMSTAHDRVPINEERLKKKNNIHHTL
jgi:hypothetical protein